MVDANHRPSRHPGAGYLAEPTHPPVGPQSLHKRRNPPLPLGSRSSRSRRAGVQVGRRVVEVRVGGKVAAMSSPWTDRATLTGAQYRTEANLAARQSVYAFQRPRL